MRGLGAVLFGLSGAVLLTSCTPFRPLTRAAAATSAVKVQAEAELIALVKAHNERRAAEKLPPLARNDRLTAAAARHARDMAAHKKLSHEGRDGSTMQQRIEEAGYHGRSMAENVAEGYESVDSAMEGWMDSPGHRANILGHFDEIGAAWADGPDDARYWSVEFGLSWPRLDPDAATADLLAGLNKARKEADKPPLKSEPKLRAAARRHARENAERDGFDARDDGKALFEQINVSGYQYRQLTVSDAAGQATPAGALKSWLDDPKRRAEVLGDFTDVGLGYERSATGKPYWTGIFAIPMGDR
jgi:uncharacterized protein YkwD